MNLKEELIHWTKFFSIIIFIPLGVGFLYYLIFPDCISIILGAMVWYSILIVYLIADLYNHPETWEEYKDV